MYIEGFEKALCQHFTSKIYLNNILIIMIQQSLSPDLYVKILQDKHC